MRRMGEGVAFPECSMVKVCLSPVVSDGGHLRIKIKCQVEGQGISHKAYSGALTVVIQQFCNHTE